MRYQLIKMTRRIRILLGGYKEMEEKHKLFQIPDILAHPVIIAKMLEGHSYYYNCFSTTYKKQVYTVRKLVDMNHQIHLRFYSDGWISGHYELRPEAHSLEHLEGVELRSLTEPEKQEIKDIVAKLMAILSQVE